MAAKDKKYYWLKLKKDFFKRHDIQIIEDMPNGKDYILFYMKLLCESVDHEGNLRFNDEIPYNEQMLATITRTNIDIVRSAVKIFSQLKMMEVFDDGTYYMREVEKLIGSETYWAEKKRLQREEKKLLPNQLDSIGQCPTSPSKSKEIDIELEKEIDKEIDIKKKANRFSKPTIQQIQEYCNSRNNNVDANRFYDYYETVGWKVGKNQMKDWKAAVRTWERNNNNQSTNNQVEATPVKKNWYDI